MIRVAEIFGPTIQGEGVLIGLPTVFVRTGGCDYRCSWCDSLHAVDSAFRHTWTPMEPEAVMARIEDLSGGRPLTVSLSGGNPAIQPLGPLIALGHAKGYRFALETQGSVAKPWFADLDTLVLSPKPPSSGEVTDWDAFAACLVPGPETIMKIVIFDDADYAYARAAHARFPQLPLYLQPGNPMVDEAKAVDQNGLVDRMLWLIDKTVQDGWFAPRILPQLHVILWGNRRGV
ncbi:7-carboxy-7-deazaguanine synthase QueE [Falsirhodobacter halotolerans]|uniref:7-carboxy-7-deazaguanine synthase QueE n=1 Tax=Falsirhodobacter halotolerans TaxID=1146892 RepID=UPI001FD59FEB|nr:7-carboxy-7-deazaguanine synthase QueE [Falsirhodobacter halotolerans]MCJ8141165.1 7-carboxy-7-deazaguanine synthase QueE [Falsirhodobacter halotolerans]